MTGHDLGQGAMVELLHSGCISLPVLLFTEYKQLGLNEKNVMLLIHLMLFQEKEANAFPTVSELKTRMMLSDEEIVATLQQLVQGGFLEIEEVKGQDVLSERYSVKPLFHHLVASFTNQKTVKEEKQEVSYQSIFSLFEQELGRPLSPMECETLVGWLEKDGYSEPLIQAALQEAVFCDKVSIRYIDRILIEWERQEVKTPAQAVDYAQKRRKKGVSQLSTTNKDVPTFNFYNWVNQE